MRGRREGEDRYERRRDERGGKERGKNIILKGRGEEKREGGVEGGKDEQERDREKREEVEREERIE